MSKVLAFIPARGGSKSIPNKNIKLLNGRPLIWWSLRELQITKEVDEIVVATDSDEIENIVNGSLFTKVKVYRRKSENAQDHSTTESVMLEYLQEMGTGDFENIMLVQATSPFTQSEDYKKGISMLQQGYDSVLSCVRMKRFFWSLEGAPINYDYKHRPRRQDFDGVFVENGAFYIVGIAKILTEKNRLGGEVGIVEMPEHSYLELDEPDDWQQAEFIMKKNGFQPDFPEIKLFATDVDGVLTDAGMFYTAEGDIMKKFNTHDGMGMNLLQEKGVKLAVITSENTEIVKKRAQKLKVDYVYLGKRFGGKLDALQEICADMNISLKQVAYIGDDVNCINALNAVGIAACPANATPKVKAIPGIIQLQKSGGEGVVREFIELLLRN